MIGYPITSKYLTREYIWEGPKTAQYFKNWQLYLDTANSLKASDLTTYNTMMAPFIFKAFSYEVCPYPAKYCVPFPLVQYTPYLDKYCIPQFQTFEVKTVNDEPTIRITSSSDWFKKSITFGENLSLIKYINKGEPFNLPVFNV
jgi:hypothetical protein